MKKSKPFVKMSKSIRYHICLLKSWLHFSKMKGKKYTEKLPTLIWFTQINIDDFRFNEVSKNHEKISEATN